MAVVMILAGATALWVVAAISAVRGFRGLQRLGDMPLARPDTWPTLSVIVPALNEARTIEVALNSLVATSYPKLEVIAVDDRSTDGTGAIIDRLAAQSARLRALHITELPDRWLGKVHALHRGAVEASGEWVLFTDADVHFAPGALEGAIAAAEGGALDHLAIFPRVHAPGLALQAVITSFAVGFSLLIRPHQARNPRSRAAVGVGAFNLVRRSAFDRTPGFEWLRMEVADDVGLGLMLKQHGGRSDCAVGYDQIAIEWYPTVSALVRGLEKNSFGPISGYSLVRFLLVLIVVALFSVAPFVLPFVAPAPWAMALSATALVLWHLVHIGTSMMSGHGVIAGLLGPSVGGAVMFLTTIRSAWRFARQGGTIWRGTFYSATDLRAGRRLKVL